MTGFSSDSHGSFYHTPPLRLWIPLACSNFAVALLIAILSPKGRGNSRWHQFGQKAYDALSPGTVAPKYCLDFWCFAVCSYCSTDLYSLWSAVGCFAEASIRLFAAELVLVLCKWNRSGNGNEGRIKGRGTEKIIDINSGGQRTGIGMGWGLPGKSERAGDLQHTPCLLSSTGYLHDLGIIHRDVKVELSAFSLCLRRGLSKKFQQVRRQGGSDNSWLWGTYGC